LGEIHTPLVYQPTQNVPEEGSAQNLIDETRETRHRPPPKGAGDGVFRGYQLGFAHSPEEPKNVILPKTSDQNGKRSV
jgi:hypothetical protein